MITPYDRLDARSQPNTKEEQSSGPNFGTSECIKEYRTTVDAVKEFRNPFQKLSIPESELEDVQSNPAHPDQDLKKPKPNQLEATSAINPPKRQ